MEICAISDIKKEKQSKIILLAPGWLLFFFHRPSIFGRILILKYERQTLATTEMPPLFVHSWLYKEQKTYVEEKGRLHLAFFFLNCAFLSALVRPCAHEMGACRALLAGPMILLLSSRSIWRRAASGRYRFWDHPMHLLLYKAEKPRNSMHARSVAVASYVMLVCAYL